MSADDYTRTARAPRPVRVGKAGGRWWLFDAGGRMLGRSGQPAGQTLACCWLHAMQAADLLADAYRRLGPAPADRPPRDVVRFTNVTWRWEP